MGVFDRMIDQHGGNRAGAAKTLSQLATEARGSGGSMKIALDLRGIEELIRKFERLGKRISTSVKLRALRAGGEIVRGAFRAASPVGPTGNLRRGQTVKVATYGSGVSVAVIGADYSIAPHAHLVEWGTTDRYRKKFATRPKRGFTGHVKATQVFTRTFESVKGAAESAMKNELEIGLNQY